MDSPTSNLDIASLQQENSMLKEQEAALLKRNEALVKENSTLKKGAIKARNKALHEKNLAFQKSLTMQLEAASLLRRGCSLLEEANACQKETLKVRGTNTGSSQPAIDAPEKKYVTRIVEVHACPLCNHMFKEFGISQKSPFHSTQEDKPENILVESCGHIADLDTEARSGHLLLSSFCRVCLHKPVNKQHKEENCHFLRRVRKLKCKQCHLRMTNCGEHKQANLAKLEHLKEIYSGYGFNFEF